MLLSTPLNAVIAKVRSVNTDATAVYNLAALYLEANLFFSEFINYLLRRQRVLTINMHHTL